MNYMIKKYSCLYILGTISKALRKIKVPKFICRLYNDKYHLIIKKNLAHYFDEIYSTFNFYDYTVYNSEIIWIFWWQGIQNAPLIVRKCINSIIYHSNGHKVIIIDKGNIKRYADIPMYIYTRLHKGEITLTSFSDILRFNLLRNYGGLWIDSTMYCASNISKYLGNIYTSGGYPDPYNFFVSSKWTSFLIGGCRNNPIFVFMDDFFKLYWKLNSHIIDYFLVDYALNYVYKYNIGKFQDYVDEKACKNNPCLHDLQCLLNHKYNKKTYLQLTKDTNMFKLTYKKRFVNGDTFYKRLISNKLGK